jgi:glycosyltransferase involved in cell wall biosynthesis
MTDRRNASKAHPVLFPASLVAQNTLVMQNKPRMSPPPSHLSTVPGPAVLEPLAQPAASAAVTSQPCRVLVNFATVFLYGMERAVIETFELLRPEVEAHLVVSYTNQRLHLPLLDEIRRSGLSYSFFSDHHDWPTLGMPRSALEAYHMIVSVARANFDIARHARRSDVVYLPSPKYLPYALLAVLYFRFTKRRVVLEMHDLYRRRTLLLRLALRAVTDLIHHSEYGYTRVKQLAPAVVCKRNIILPVRIAEPGAVSAAPDLKEAFQGHRNIVFAGQVSNHKGIDLLLEAFKSIAREFSDAQLHIFGACANPEQFQLAIANPEFQGRVRHWGFRTDVRDAIGLACCYVQPSPPSITQESFGRGVVEAMSMGVPAVAFRSGALAGIIVDQETGLLCRAEIAPHLADALGRFLREPALRDACGRAARKRYEAEYSDHAIRHRWAKFFCEDQPVQPC